MNELVATDDGIRLFCSFRTEGRLYGIDALQVREISAHVEIAPVAQAPSAMRGLANLRSRVYLVVDVRPILGLAPAECTTESRLIILKPHLAENFGVLVEQGGDIVSVRPAEIEATSTPAQAETDAAGDRPPNVVVGVCKLEGELMNIIDSERLIETLEAFMQ